ncbi:MAG: hypothetical protein U1E37_00600 [Sphingomonadaceae bacterium]
MAAQPGAAFGQDIAPAATAAQEAAAAPSPAPPAKAAPVCASPAGAAAKRCVPALTPVIISLDQPVSSRTAKTGESFAFSLAEPILLNGEAVVPTGTRGTGEVVHAKGTGIGVGGELVLAARTLDVNGKPVRLRSMRFGVVGKDQQDLVFAAGIAVGLPALFIRGKHIDIPQGALATAKLAEDLILDAPAAEPAAPEAAPGAVPATSTPPLQPGSA